MVRGNGGHRGEACVSYIASALRKSRRGQILSGALHREQHRATGGGFVKKRIFLGLIPLVAAAAGLVVATGAVSSPESATTLPSSSCGPVFYKGSGKPQFLIATDLPLQGAGRAQNIAM